MAISNLDERHHVVLHFATSESFCHACRLAPSGAKEGTRHPESWPRQKQSAADLSSEMPRERYSTFRSKYFFIAAPQPASGVQAPSAGTSRGISECVRSQSSMSTIERYAAERRRALPGFVPFGCNPQAHWHAWHDTCVRSIGIVVWETRGAAPD